MFEDVEEDPGDIRVMFQLLQDLGFRVNMEYDRRSQCCFYEHPKMPQFAIAVMWGLGGWYFIHNGTECGPRGQYSFYDSHKREDILKDLKESPCYILFRAGKIENLLKA